DRECLDVQKFDVVMKAVRGSLLIKMLKESNLLRDCGFGKLVFFLLRMFVDYDAFFPLKPMDLNCKASQAQEIVSIDLKKELISVFKNALKQTKRALDLYTDCSSIVKYFKEAFLEYLRNLSISRFKFNSVFPKRNYLSDTQIRLTNGTSGSCQNHWISLRNGNNTFVSSFKQLHCSPVINRISTTTPMVCVVLPYYGTFHQSYTHIVMVISEINLLCICASNIQNNLKMCAYFVLLCHHILTFCLIQCSWVLMTSYVKSTLRNNDISTYSVSCLREKIWLPLDQIHYHRTYTIFPAFAPMMSIVDRLAKKEKVHPKESMRYEMMRFCTLRSYPAEGKPSVLKFAKAGFYYASNKDEVICYCCAKRISNWKPDDDPYQAHKRITPNCSFIVNNGDVNVPVSNVTVTNANDVLQKIITDLDDNNTVWRFDSENSDSDSENDIASDDDERNEDQNNRIPLVTENHMKETQFVPKQNYNVIDTVTRAKDSGFVSLPIEPTNTSVSLEEDCFRPKPQGGFASMAPISENRTIDPTFQTGMVLPLNDLSTHIKTIHTIAYQPTQNDPPRQRKSNRISRRRTRRQRQSPAPSDPPGIDIRTERAGETSAAYQQSSVPERKPTNKTAQYLKIPKYPKFSTLSSRISSFNQCPEIHVMPRTLAEAGFFYAGIGDCTRCFCCGIGLRHWTREDDPWTEHARFSLECDHVQINKGQEFINLVKLTLDLTEEKKRRLKNENKALKESTMCSSCRKNEVCIVFLPCGHLISCELCGNTVRTCISCGQRVRGTIPK
ncbi:IAP3-like protein, partial [Mya arenaria]